MKDQDLPLCLMQKGCRHSNPLSAEDEKDLGLVAKALRSKAQVGLEAPDYGAVATGEPPLWAASGAPPARSYMGPGGQRKAADSVTMAPSTAPAPLKPSRQPGMLSTAGVARAVDLSAGPEASRDPGPHPSETTHLVPPSPPHPPLSGPRQPTCGTFK